MGKDQVKILLIEDDEDDYAVVRKLLSEATLADFSLEWVKTYEEGFKELCRADYDAFLLDYRLESRNGLELIREATGAGCDKPIIFLTGQGDYGVDTEAMRSGAADYLIKAQLTGDMLGRSIRYSIARKDAERELKSYRNRLEDLVKERTEQLETANEKLRVEIAERKKAETSIREQKEFLSTVINALHHPFYVINADDYTIQMANLAAAPGGLPPNTTCHALTHYAPEPCNKSEHVCPLKTIMQTGRPLTTEHLHYDPEGNTRYVEVHGHPILDAKGNVVQIVEYSLDITERKRVEEEFRSVRDALAKEKSLLQAVLNQMRSGVIVAEPDGGIILANDQSGEMFEHDERHTHQRYEHLEYHALHQDGRPYDPGDLPLNRSLEKGEIVTNEEIAIAPPGGAKTKIILASSSPVRDPSGKIVAAAMTFHDITEKKKAEEELYRREQEYRALVENSPDVIIRVDREFRRVYANQALETVTGFPLSEFIGSSLFVPAREGRLEYIALMEKACTKVFSTGEDTAFEFSYPTTKGTRYFHMRLVPEYSPKGGIESLLTISRDVTDLKQVQEELQKARDELELRVQERTAQLAQSNKALKLDDARLETLWTLSQMTEASSEEIFAFTLQQLIRLTRSKVGVIGLVNEDEGVIAHYACTAEFLEEGQTLYRPFEFPIEKSRLLSEVIKNREPVIIDELDKGDLDEICRHVPGTIVRFMTVPITVGDRVVLLAMAGNKGEKYDSSDIRQLSLLLDGMWKLVQRRKAEIDLREAESLAAMGRSLAAVAHDIKTPLIAIGGFSRLVHTHLDEANPDREKLAIVINEVHRLESSLKQILDFSRPLELDKSLQDLNRVILESLVMIEDAVREHGLTIETRFADIPPVSLDPMRMKQVVMNLVINAVQASSPGKIVSVTTHLKGKRLLIDVADCGCGIPVQKRDEIFAPFVSTKKEGTGLGLAISKKIVEAHHGRIEILDNAEQGVTIRISLPAIIEGLT
jgi:PAS domain S-box-containing protein